jgi:hypothetical protein
MTFDHIQPEVTWEFYLEKIILIWKKHLIILYLRRTNQNPKVLETPIPICSIPQQ